MYRGSLFVSVMGGTIESNLSFRPELLGSKKQIPCRFAPWNDNPAKGAGCELYGRHPLEAL